MHVVVQALLFVTECFYCYWVILFNGTALFLFAYKKYKKKRLVLTAHLWRRRIKCLRRVINDKEDGDAVDPYLSCYKSKLMLLISKKYSHLKRVKLTAHPCSSPTDWTGNASCVCIQTVGGSGRKPAGMQRADWNQVLLWCGFLATWAFIRSVKISLPLLLIH